MKKLEWNRERRVFLALTLGFALSNIACGEKPKEGSADTSPATAAPAADAPAVSPNPDAATTAAYEAARMTPFGVPECDKYVKQFMACVESHVSGEQKEKLLEALDANRVKWRAMASMREGAVALSLACRTAAQKSKDELTVDYGCEFPN